MKQDVTLYAISTCVHCTRTKELLLELLGQDGFTCVYTDRLSGDERNVTIRILRRVNPDLSFPTTVIGDAVVIGFKEDKLRALLGK